MGIISDILEANKERAGVLLSSREIAYRRKPVPTRGTVECPLCALWFLDEAGLQTHIVDAHRSIQAYIKINERVVHETVFIAEAITSLEAVSFGESRNRVEVILSDGVSRTRRLSSNRATQIVDLIPAQFFGIFDIKLHYGNAERRTKVYCREAPVMDVEPLDGGVQTLQRAFLTTGQPRADGFQELIDRMRRDPAKELQFRYLAGFFEYFIGSDLEKRCLSMAGNHFESAFGYLRPFATDMAHTTRCILGLKMNWFGLLRDCGPGSPFYPARQFFLDKVPQVHSKRNAKTKDQNAAARGIFIDSFSETYLRALVPFCSGDYDQVTRLLNELERNPLAKDRNNENKLWLLRARVSKARGDSEKARQAYSILVSDPAFEPEAEENL